MGSIESRNGDTNGELSDDEKAFVDDYREWYKKAKETYPNSTKEGLRKDIIKFLSQDLEYTDYSTDDELASLPEDQRARLEMLVDMIMDSPEESGEGAADWESLSENPED